MSMAAFALTAVEFGKNTLRDTKAYLPPGPLQKGFANTYISSIIQTRKSKHCCELQAE